MNKLNNGINLKIQRDFYNKTKVQEDGITHIVDTEHDYPLYQLEISKSYKDIYEDDLVIKEIIKDLQYTIQTLEQVLSKDQQNER